MTALEPHDIAMEAATLGAMMSSPAVADQIRRQLVSSDFYRPANQLVFETIIKVMDAGLTPDALIVMDTMSTDGTISRIGGAVYLHTLLAACPLAASGGYYAEAVRRHAVTRRLRVAAKRILQATEAADLPDPSALTEQALRDIEAVRRDGGTGSVTALRIDKFMAAGGDTEYDWVIPGLLERGDRFVLTGAEGGGKSELFRQMAVQAAAGLHPFSLVRVPPVRCLYLDCQDGPAQARRKFTPLLARAASCDQPVDPEMLWVECRADSVDLATDRSVSWMLEQVTAIKPDITFIGPLVKLAPRALNSDDEAAPVIAALDMIRARGSCVVLEAHAGHGIGPGGRRDVRPRGSSAFLGWPEFGYGLRWNDDATRMCRVMDVVAWRGDRDERSWPEKLTSAGFWPWSETV